MIQLTKGAVKMWYEIVLLRDRVHHLVQANKAATKRKSRKRKQIQREGTLTGEQGSKLILQKVAVVTQENKRSQRESAEDATTRQKRRCRHCGKTGHNIRTCRNDKVDIS